MAKSSIRVIILVLMALSSACTSRNFIPHNRDGRHETSAIPEAVELFSYQETPLNMTIEPLDALSSKHHEVSHLEFSSTGKNGQADNRVNVHYYQGRGGAAKPLVIVLPIWGSYTYPSRKIGKGIRRRGKGDVHVMMVQGEAPLFDWEAMHEDGPPASFEHTLWRQAERIRYTSMDMRRILDWAETRPEIDATRVALVGFSMGAIVSSLSIMHDRRFNTAVLVMGGAHLGKVVATCHGRLELLRATAMGRYGWDLKQMETVADRAFGHVDQRQFPGRVDAGSVLFIDASRDKCMPQVSRDTLWEALGRPERISYRYGHHSAFLAMTPLGLNVMRRQIYRFLEKRLGYGKAAD